MVSKSELKKREKIRKAAKAKAEKEAKKKEMEEKKAAEGKAPAKKKQNEDELDPSKYTENRKNMLEERRKNGDNPYPHKFHRTLTIPAYRAKFEKETIENG
jgi:lysyl-tRNA synthetase class 2